MSTALTKNKKKAIYDKNSYYRFWKDTTNSGVYNMIIQGKTVAEVSLALDLSYIKLERILSHPAFLKRLDAQLKTVMFGNQAAKILASEEVFSKLWERIRNNIDQISVEVCLKEFTKLLPYIQEPAKLMTPSNINIFLNNPQNKETQIAYEYNDTIKETEDRFGYTGLAEDPEANYLEEDNQNIYEEANYTGVDEASRLKDE
jgi:hypothetical protein